MTFRVHDAHGNPTRSVYTSDIKATRALKRRKEIGSAVVWYNDAGVSKVWFSYWTEAGWQESEFSKNLNRAG